QEELAARFEAWGAQNALAWARSELGEDIAQSARFLVLRAVWRRMNDALNLAVSDAAMTGALAGSYETASDIASVIRRCLYTYTFDVLYLLDQAEGRRHPDGPHTDVGHDDPRWVLMEVSPDGE